MITLLYFARLREQIGTGAESHELPQGVTTLTDLVTWLRAQGPQYATAFQDMDKVRAAVNEQAATPDTPLKDGDEIAFFPPMTGG